MAVKVKRKSSSSSGEDDSSSTTSGESVNNSPTEPPPKKQRVIDAEEFIQALKGPNATEAVRHWLFLISPKYERTVLDVDTPSGSTSKDVGENGEDEQSETQTDAMEIEENKEESNEVKEISEEVEETLESQKKIDSQEGLSYIDAFLNAGGSPADIVYTLPLPEDAKAVQIRHVFRVLTKTLLRISADHPGKVAEAIEVSRDLLNTYSKHINGVFTSTRIHDKAFALELLTAMVALDSKFGAEILGLVSLNQDIVLDFASPQPIMSVRVAYLRFLVALIIEEDNNLIFSLLQKPWFFTSIWDDIKFDPADVIILLLMSIKKAVVENKSVSKSSKQTIFSSNGIISLLSLYKWKGPQNRATSVWDARDKAKKPKLLAEVDSNEAELVASAVHELLIVLLTNFRHGIIFRDVIITSKSKNRTDRHNKVVSQVLQRIGHPWENIKVAELVSKVLAACPDSLSLVLSTIEPFMEPRSSPKWFNCAKFIKQVIENQRPEEVLLRQLSSLKAYNLVTAAMEMCTPPAILRALCSNNSAAFFTEDLAVSKSTIDLIVCMLRKISNFSATVKRWATEGLLHFAQYQTCINFIRGSLLQRLPTLDSIQRSWNMWSGKYLSDKPSEMAVESSVKPIDILSLLIELLEMYKQLSPSILEPMLSPQSELKLAMTKFVLETAHSEDTAELRNHLYHLLSGIKDESFSLENEAIREAACLIFRDLVNSSSIVRNLAWSVLMSLLKQVNALEGSSGEAVLWLSIFKETFIDKEESCGDVVSLLVDSLLRFSKSSLKYLDFIANAEEDASSILYENSGSFMSSFDERALERLFEDAPENLDGDKPSNDFNQLSVGTLGPWLPAFLETLLQHINEKKIKRRSKQAAEEFCCKLVLRLLCRLPYPGSLDSLLKTYAAAVPGQLSEYISSWLPGGNPQPTQKYLLNTNCWEENLSSFLFDGEDDEDSFSETIQKMFVKNIDYPTMKDFSYDPSHPERSETMVKVTQSVHFVCFHLTQLAQLQKLKKDFSNKAQALLLHIFDVASQFDKIMKTEEDGLLCECFKVVLSHPIMYQQFKPLARKSTDSSNLLTKLVIVVAKMASKCKSLEAYLEPFKNNVLAALKSSLSKTKLNSEMDMASIVDAFPLKFQDISNLLALVSTRSESQLVVDNGVSVKLSQWCLLTAHLLTRASDCRLKGSSDMADVMILPSSIISQVSKWIQHLLTKKDCDIMFIVKAFMSYIDTCPQQTRFIPQQSLLSCLLQAEQSSIAHCKLAEWLASHTTLKAPLNIDCRDSFPIMFAVLKARNKRNKNGKKDTEIKEQFSPLYDAIQYEVKQSVISSTNHPHWLRANVNEVVYLMKCHLQPDEREQLCKALEKKAPGLTQEKSYYLQLVTEVLKEHPGQLLMVLLAWLGASLKKHGSSGDQVDLVTSICQATIKFLQEEPSGDLASIKTSNVWQETLRLSLKLGLSVVVSPVKKFEDGLPITETNLSSLLLQTLTLIFNKMYTLEEEHEHIAMVHSMITQHSEFLNIMMGSSSSKFELVQLLYVLLEKNPKIMKNSDAPVFLSAYSATLTKTDRALLRILMLYEKYRIDLSQYRPFFWGHRGADHYSVWSFGSKNPTLQQQPKPEHVLALLDIDMVINTISNFPIHSTLKVAENEAISIDGVYDPSFYLPMFIHLLSPESPINPFMVLRSGALALSFASLSSFDVAVRAAAYTALTRYVSHLQMAWGTSKKLILHFMSAVQKGVSAYDGQNPRLPSIVSVFLAQFSLVIDNPLHALCTPLTNFVLAKPDMNLRTVPNVMALLHSNEVFHLEHRHWILKVLYDGMRSPSDFKMCVETIPVMKFLLSFYSSCVCDSESQMLILQFLKSAVEIQYGACCLVKSYGLTSWLHHTILNLDVENSKSITEMTSILCALWTSLSLPPLEKDDPEAGCVRAHVEDPARKVLHLLLAIRSKLTAPVGNDTLDKYFSCFHDVMKYLPTEDVLKVTKDIVVSIIDLSSSYCSDKRQFFDLLDLGCDFIGINESVHPNVSKMSTSLKALIIQWIKSRNSANKKKKGTT